RPPRRRPLRRRELRVPRIRLYAPVEDHILPADRGDPQRGVMIRAGFVALEHVAVTGHCLVHVAGVAARGREIDRRQICYGLRAVKLHAVTAEPRLRSEERRVGKEGRGRWASYLVITEEELSVERNVRV